MSKTTKRKTQERGPEQDTAAAADTQETPESGAAAAQADAGENTVEAPDYKALYDEVNERLLRVRAEFDNYRKRLQRDMADLRVQVRSATLQEFLPVFDHFEMALAHADQAADPEALTQGMAMIKAEFRRTLESLGVEIIQAEGQPFDPGYHEAVAQEPSATIPEGHVIKQWKNGFRIGERLIRPAAVVVSAGPVGADGGEAAGGDAES